MSKKKHTHTKLPKYYTQYVVHTDGGCSGNPGPMSIGGIIEKVDTDGHRKTIHQFSQALGFGTNNEAEYWAVITALKYLVSIKPESVLMLSDSQLVVNQMQGAWGVNQPHLARLYGKAMGLVENIKSNGGRVIFAWIPREYNEKADELAGQAEVPKQQEETTELCLDTNYKPDLSKLPKIAPECQKQIEYILSHKAKFRDYVDLKTNGIDGFSRLKVKELIEIIELRFGQTAVKWLTDTIGSLETDYAKKILKWTARGLPPNLAIKKVEVDMEVSDNALKARNGDGFSKENFYE